MGKKDGDYDGMNEHKKQQKIKAGAKNDKIFEEFFFDKDIEVLTEINKIRKFIYREKIYYFAITSGTIRRQGDDLWRSFKDFCIEMKYITIPAEELKKGNK